MKLLKKICMPIFLSIICGALCGRLLFSIYEDKERMLLESDVIYLLEDSSYKDYDSMKASTINNNYIYYKDNDKYITAIGITKDKDNIEKIKKAYDKDVRVGKYLQENTEINIKLEEYDKKIASTESSTEIKTLVEEVNTLYKGRDDIKMAKIS